MAKIKDCAFLFIAGIEGSGTSLILQLLDNISGFTCLGGNYVSPGFKETGVLMNQLTKALWKLPRVLKAERSELIEKINEIEVGDTNTVVYKRSYPFSSIDYMPELNDVTALGRSSEIVLMRRHFFDNVNSILRRGFETEIEIAANRIALGYTHLYKQSLLMHSSKVPMHILDYDKLVADDTKLLELEHLSRFLSLGSGGLFPYSDLIGKPVTNKVLLQRNRE